MSWPASAMALAPAGVRSSARAQPKMVIGICRSAKRRMIRQKPAREPYSNIPSAARSRSPAGTGELGTSTRPMSVRPSPFSNEYSEPSS